MKQVLTMTAAELEAIAAALRGLNEEEPPLPPDHITFIPDGSGLAVVMDTGPRMDAKVGQLTTRFGDNWEFLPSSPVEFTRKDGTPLEDEDS